MSVNLDEYRARRARLGFKDNCAPIASVPIVDSAEPSPIKPEPSPLKKELDALAKVGPDGPEGYVSMAEIKRLVAKRFGYTALDLESESRTKSIAYARHVAMYLCHKYSRRSYPIIGKAFGDRDHSTVIYAIKRIKTLIAEIGDSALNPPEDY